VEDGHIIYVNLIHLWLPCNACNNYLTATAALQNGEVDWWEYLIPDVVPLLRKNRNVMVDIADPLGNVGALRVNHLHPLFNDVRAKN
jgi:hypothetical protein